LKQQERALPKMRLLLDESVPSRFGRALADHMVKTVVEAGWSWVKNGKLLTLAAAEFDAFITVDKKLPFQQNLASLPIALLVLDSFSNELPGQLPLVPALSRELAMLKPKTYVLVRAA
jgi:hypothetical protein